MREPVVVMEEGRRDAAFSVGTTGRKGLKGLAVSRYDGTLTRESRALGSLGLNLLIVQMGGSIVERATEN